MSERTKQLSGNLFQVDLDGEIVTLPWRSLKSVMGIFEHLEHVASSRERESEAVAGRGAPERRRPKPAKGAMLEGVQSDGVRFRELGRQVIRTAQSQVRMLQARAQEVQALVLINNWTVAERLWSGLLTECKMPLFELNFLEELWGISPDHLEMEGWSLTRHWHQFVLLQAEVEIILARRQNPVELSDTLEGQLGNWLKRFGGILEKLDEESAA
jgi:hypothetical protein